MVGEPKGSEPYWGGYCQHADVLFPTWHRFYVHTLEQALQTIVPGVMQPYWDETSEESLKNGIPWALTRQKVTIDGVEQDNPLLSYTFQEKVKDPSYDINPKTQMFDYSKPEGYTTVRYPLSGIVINPPAEAAAYNKRWEELGYDERLAALNYNVTQWLNDGTPLQPQAGFGIYHYFKKCLRQPDYNVFSTTTASPKHALENPHNLIHLSVGGFRDDPVSGAGQNLNWPPGTWANGDMGENETAAFDPIFFFHHCNIDRMFWVWQKQQGFTENFTIIPNSKGTTGKEGQGGTPGIPDTEELTMATPLYPFTYQGGDAKSKHCINIEKQLGYTYSIGSLDDGGANLTEAMESSAADITIKDFPRINSSFVVYAIEVKADGSKQTVGKYGVFGRRNNKVCKNCQNHPVMDLVIELTRDTVERVRNESSKIELHIALPGRELILYESFVNVLPNQPSVEVSVAEGVDAVGVAHSKGLLSFASSS